MADFLIVLPNGKYGETEDRDPMDTHVGDIVAVYPHNHVETATWGSDHLALLRVTGVNVAKGSRYLAPDDEMDGPNDGKGNPAPRRVRRKRWRFRFLDMTPAARRNLNNNKLHTTNWNTARMWLKNKRTGEVAT